MTQTSEVTEQRFKEVYTPVIRIQNSEYIQVPCPSPNVPVRIVYTYKQGVWQTCMNVATSHQHIIK